MACSRGARICGRGRVRTRTGRIRPALRPIRISTCTRSHTPRWSPTRTSSKIRVTDRRESSLLLARRVAAALLLWAVAACGGALSPRSPGNRPTLPTTYRPSGHMAAGDVFVHLFEWTWTDIAAECENVLGPAGFKAVQISPPEEHSIVPSHDWRERYQPVSYSIAHSRSGTGAECTDMVTCCTTVGRVL